MFCYTCVVHVLKSMHIFAHYSHSAEVIELGTRYSPTINAELKYNDVC